MLGRNLSNKDKKIGPINSNDKLVSDEFEIANILNDHFCSIAHNLDQQIPYTNYISSVNENLTSLHLEPVTPDEVSSIIMGLKNSRSNSNGISTYLLKKKLNIYYARH